MPRVFRVVGQPKVDGRDRYVGWEEDREVEPGQDIYREYYHDCRPHGWAGLVQGRSKYVGGRCEVCGGNAQTVHHVDGKSPRWGNVICICHDCHRKVHQG